MFARVALAAALCCAVGARAGADRRPVAVVDLTPDGAASQHGKDLGEALNNHDLLKPLDDLSMPAQLLGELRDDDVERLAEVSRALREAETLFENREWARASSTAGAAATKLLVSLPTRPALALHARLAAVQAQALLGDRKSSEAGALFRLALALDPELTLDPARTLPEVLAAFEAARRAIPAGMGTIAVVGRGTAILDGRELGAAPAWFEAPAGQHVLWVVGPDRDPRGVVVTVVPRQKVEAVLEDAPTSTVTKVRRSRLALARIIASDNPDRAPRLAAMSELANLLGIADAVLFVAPAGKLSSLTWRRGVPGFAAPREFRERDRPADLLDALAPKRRAIEPFPVEFPEPPAAPQAWYQRKRYWGLGGGSLAVIIGGVLLYRSWDRTIGTNPNTRVAETQR